MSGQQRGAMASVLRGVLSMAEPCYSQIVSWRNRRFDAGIGVRKLSRPVISVGNITAGGTGKTPVVRWLCEQFRVAGRHPAVLMRGYKSKDGVSDEQQMLVQALHSPNESSIIVHVNPDRFAGGTDVLREHPEVDLFILDDGFQHRKLDRDFDLVLINATEPFGFGHVHPRGLLREPLSGLRRADAVLITRSDEVEAAKLKEIEREIERYCPGKPIVHASHAPVRLLDDESKRDIEKLTGKRVFAFCGIGDPESFFRQIKERAGQVVGTRAFPDHHAYRETDLAEIETAAVGAEAMITTEKDWAKLASLRRTAIPIWRIEMAIRFREGDEVRLLTHVLKSRLGP